VTGRLHGHGRLRRRSPARTSALSGSRLGYYGRAASSSSRLGSRALAGQIVNEFLLVAETLDAEEKLADVIQD
jgi:hypothetical protein